MSEIVVSEQFSPPPGGAEVDLLVVAGEHSGDQHAATLVSDFLQNRPTATVAALGGPALGRAGAHLLYDLTDLSVVGLVEVLRHYSQFKILFEKTLSWIETYQPKVVCLVDYPGFNLRLAAAMKKRGLSRKGGGDIVVLGYISPQIWAWKAKRRFKMQEWLDELGTIFPFEVECYKDTSLPTFFLGHPFTDPRYELQVKLDPQGPLLLLPGSRQAAVKRIFPVMLRGVEKARHLLGDRPVRVLYPGTGIHELLKEILHEYGEDRLPIDMRPVSQGSTGSAVLTSSGTMSLQCALAGLPGTIVYRAHPFSYWIGKRVVKIPYLGIANILLERDFYPEYIQGDATPKALASRIEKMLMTESYELAKEGAEELRKLLSVNRYLDPAVWVESHLDSNPAIIQSK